MATRRRSCSGSPPLARLRGPLYEFQLKPRLKITSVSVSRLLEDHEIVVARTPSPKSSPYTSSRQTTLLEPFRGAMKAVESRVARNATWLIVLFHIASATSVTAFQSELPSIRGSPDLPCCRCITTSV